MEAPASTSVRLEDGGRVRQSLAHDDSMHVTDEDVRVLTGSSSSGGSWVEKLTQEWGLEMDV